MLVIWLIFTQWHTDCVCVCSCWIETWTLVFLFNIHLIQKTKEKKHCFFRSVDVVLVLPVLLNSYVNSIFDMRYSGNKHGNYRKNTNRKLNVVYPVYQFINFTNYPNTGNTMLNSNFNEKYSWNTFLIRRIFRRQYSAGQYWTSKYANSTST